MLRAWLSAWLVCVRLDRRALSWSDNTLDLYDPSHTVVEATMFLGTHAILHAMNRTDRWGDATVEVYAGIDVTAPPAGVVRALCAFVSQ